MRSFLAFCALVIWPISMDAQNVADSKSRPSIGLALEGGGALALAHVGLIEWFEQHHIPIDYVAGTSMGGLVGGFYASGMNAAEMRRKVRSLDWDKLVNGATDYKSLSFRRKEDDRRLGNTLAAGLKHGLLLPSGLDSGQALEVLLSEIGLPYGEIRNFDDLPTPFRCVATDLVSSKQKVFSSGLLEQALRATMSIPGLYEPSFQAEGTGGETHEYVDGGLLNNLPVDLVKAMGANIVIAVYLATDPYDPNKPRTAIGVLSRSVSAVMAANERHNIETADMLISIDLSGFSVSDFTRAEEIMDRGLAGTEKRKTLLSKFAMNEPEWQAFLKRKEARRKTRLPEPQFIVVTGLDNPSGKHDEKLAGDVRSYFVEQIGKPLDPAWVEAQIANIMGMGFFAHMAYAEIIRDGKPGLEILVQRSTSRPPTIQPSIGVDGSDYLDPRFSLVARLTAANLGGFRSELRTDFLLGNTYGLGAEYFHPFTPLSKWFIAPHGLAENRPLDFYHRSRIVAFDRERTAGGGVDFGYSIRNTAEFRLGYDANYVSTSFRTGQESAFPIVAGRYGATHLSYSYDRVDDEIVPHSGVWARGDLRWVDANPGSAGHMPVLEIKGTFFEPFGARATGFASAEGGSIFNNRNSGLPMFFLGGPQVLSAYGRNELFGNQYFLGRLGVLRQVSSSIPFADGRIYLFADLEIAKMYGFNDSTALPMDANAGVLIRTLLGPVFVGGSIGDAGHRKWYFQLGRFF